MHQKSQEQIVQASVDGPKAERAFHTEQRVAGMIEYVSDEIQYLLNSQQKLNALLEDALSWANHRGTEEDQRIYDVLRIQRQENHAAINRLIGIATYLRKQGLIDSLKFDHIVQEATKQGVFVEDSHSQH